MRTTAYLSTRPRYGLMDLAALLFRELWVMVAVFLAICILGVILILTTISKTYTARAGRQIGGCAHERRIPANRVNRSTLRPCALTIGYDCKASLTPKPPHESLMSMDRRHLLFALASAGALTACSGVAGLGGPAQTPDFPDIAFADWTDAEPEYLVYPGDELDIQTPTAPELNRAVRVGPDGRITMPLVGQIMAADRSLPELEASLAEAYASQLRHPMVEVTLTQAGPMKVWVDGEVRTPGVYDMPGDIEAWQAVIMAGGFLPSARRAQVALIRRGPGNVRMMRVVDLSGPRTTAVALRRSDIIFVPRTTLAELAVFFTQVRESLPVSFSYSINDRAYTQF